MRHIDTKRFCSEGNSLSGIYTERDLPRLAAEVLAGSQFNVAWSVIGASPAALDLKLKSIVAMKCQRCLAPMTESIDVQYCFQFVKNEATAQAQDEVSDEVDILVHSCQFDLDVLIEDEILMALPFVSLHAVCPVPSAASFLPLDAKPNPFAVLQNLKINT